MNRHHLSSEQLSSYLDGEVSTQESRAIAAHLAVCDDCRDRFDGMQNLVSGLLRLEREGPPPELASRVLGQVEAVAEGRRSVRPDWRGRLAYLFGVPHQPVLRNASVVGLAFVFSLFLVTNGAEVGRPQRLPQAVLPMESQPPTEVVTVEPAGRFAPLFLPPTTSKVAGREFVWTDNGGIRDLWVQRGLEGNKPEARFAAESPVGRELLNRYSELRLLISDGSRVVLRYRLETIEISTGEQLSHGV